MLVVETISDGNKMAQTQTRELRWAMSGIKRRYIFAATETFRITFSDLPLPDFYPQ